MSYSITPTLGVAPNLTYSTTTTPPAGTTGSLFPAPATQFGMTVGKVMASADGNRYILCNSGASALTANAAFQTAGPGFVAGTGTAISANVPNFAVPANSLFWGIIAGP